MREMPEPFDLEGGSKGGGGNYQYLILEINRRHAWNGSTILQLTDPSRLKDFIRSEIMELFHAGSVTFEGSGSLSPFSQIVQTAIREIRSIYIPARGADTIFVSGQPPVETTHVFEARPEQLDVDTRDLPSHAESVVILPLVSSLGRELPLEKYPRHGAIIVTKPQPKAFDPLVDLRILPMIASDMAIVLLKNHLTL